MAEYGGWNRKGATLSDVSALKEYGVDAEFITRGIRTGDLEYREGSIHGNPYIRLLRDQLETYITKERGSDYLALVKAKTELQPSGRSGEASSSDSASCKSARRPFRIVLQKAHNPCACDQLGCARSHGRRHPST